MSAEVAELRERLRYDTPFWAGGVQRDREGRWCNPGPQSWKGAARIVNKRAQLVPLIASPWQLELDELLEAQRRAGLPMRGIVLKARQLGMSTWIEAKIGQRLTQIAYQRGVVVAHDVKTAGSIFQMTEIMHAHLPTEEELGLGFSIKPDVIAASFSPNGRKFMEFGERSRRLREQGRTGSSVLDIDTAQSPESGRGQTRHLVHLSEVAKWPDTATSGTKSKMVSVLNSVPYEPETLVVLESTANGLNHFYRRWMSAVEGQDDPDTGETYATLFVPWWRDPAYALPFATDDERARFISSIGTGPYGEDEGDLVELYGCSPEQLRWRRMQIRTQHEDNVQLFKQENPASPEEAFIGSGRTVFSGVLISRAIKAAEDAPAPVQGTLRGAEFVERRTRAGTVMLPQRVEWVPLEDAAHEDPLLDVWEHPVTLEGQLGLPEAERKPAGAYVISVDVAEGASNTFTDGDFSVIQVFDHRSRMQVAVHESRIDIHQLPMWVLLVAIYYNRGWLAVEVNSMGLAVNDPIGKDFRYPRLYRRQRADSTLATPETKTGWETTRRTKPMIEASFGGAMQEGTHGLRHPRTARQLSTYVVDDNGRHGAQDGEHDDLLMAAMIAHRVMDVLVPPRDKRGGRLERHVYDDLTGY
jgi:hypothetical protein